MKKIPATTGYFLLFAMILLFISCSNKTSVDQKIIKSLDESLSNSTEIINLSSSQIIMSLQNKLADPATSERAIYWYPRAQQISAYTSDVNNYLKNLKRKKHLTNIEAKELFDRLRQYKQNVLAVDSSIRFEFTMNIILISRSFDTNKQTGNDFYNTFFKNSSALLTSAMLIKLQNNIKIIENKTFSYCHNMVGSVDGDGFFTSFETIVGQSSTYVKAGEKIDITAGIGSFSTHGSPVITINRKNVSLSETGVAFYSFKASNKPGKHFVPVTLEFTDQDGKKITREFTVEYTVAKECDH